jgi:hypothetical protein
MKKEIERELSGGAPRYTMAQIALHWLIVLLVIEQYGRAERSFARIPTVRSATMLTLSTRRCTQSTPVPACSSSALS